MKNVLTIILLISLILCAVGFRYSDKPKTEIGTYIVQSGDTLYDIAKKYCPKTMDWRKWAWEVQKLNNLFDNEYLIPGTEIKILKETER